ncbi:hypothetical protein DSUL_20465 [Desulfovibrionales bacterium]
MTGRLVGRLSYSLDITRFTWLGGKGSGIYWLIFLVSWHTSFTPRLWLYRDVCYVECIDRKRHNPRYFLDLILRQVFPEVSIEGSAVYLIFGRLG